MPMSVMKAVPRSRMRSSAVCTWVWVPTTALTRPSRNQAMAAFSDVASAWKSTRVIAGPGSASSRRSTHANGQSMGSR